MSDEQHANAQPAPMQISKESLLSIGIVVVLVGVAFTTGSKLTAIENGVAQNQVSIMRVKEMVEEATADRWKASDMRRWVEALEVLNPNLKIPQAKTDLD